MKKEPRFWKSFLSFINSKTKGPNINAVCITQIGRRPNHEDNFLLNGRWLTSEMQRQMINGLPVCLKSESSERVQIYMICDGMGGHQAGEVASFLCVEQFHAIREQIQSCATLQKAVDMLQQTVANANTVIFNAGQKDKSLRGMGTTLVLAVIVDGKCAVLHIGDSRAYWFDGNTLSRMTCDHTEGQRMLDLGLLTQRELADFPARKNLNHYVGCKEPGYVLSAEIYELKPQPGILLLCSDGVSDALTDYEIQGILRTQTDLEKAGRQLVSEAVATPQADNATAMLLTLRG